MSDNLSQRSEAKASTSTPTDGEASNRKNRRGKGSKSKQAEKFRTKKNEEWDSNFLAKIDSKKIELGYRNEDLFGRRQLNPVVHPQLAIPINTDTAGELSDIVSEVLHGACKVPPAQDVPPEEAVSFDAETIMWVTAYQIDAKMYYASANTQYPEPYNSERSAMAESVRVLLTDALLPLSVYIDQIGRFEIDGQEFVPKFNGVSDFAVSTFSNLTNECRCHFAAFLEVVRGIPTPFRDHHGARLNAEMVGDSMNELIARGILDQGGQMTPEFLANPALFNYQGLLDFFPAPVIPPPPDFNTVLTRYAGLKGRVNKKINNAFATIDLASGKGLSSQLVYTRSSGDNVEAWSPRNVPIDSIEIGAVLELGYASVIADEKCAFVSTLLNCGGALTALANILTKRVR